MIRRFLGLALGTALALALPGHVLAAQARVEICHIPSGDPSKARTITVAAPAVQAHLRHGDTLGPCTTQEFVIDVRANRTYGIVGTVFELSAVALGANIDAVTYHWTVGDGRTFQSSDIAVAFTQPGFYPITVAATASTGVTSEAHVGVVVHDPSHLAPNVLGLPDRLGDLNNDGRLTLLDAHRAAKFAGRVGHMPPAAQRAADLDFSGHVTFGDVELIGQAILAGQDLPDRLLTESGKPGAVVTLVSPALKNPEDLIQIRVGDSGVLQTPIRPILGYASFAIPFTGDAAAPGTKDITLLINGIATATYGFTVEAPDPLPAEPGREVIALFEDILQLLDVNKQLLAAQLDSFPLSVETRSTFLAAAEAGRNEAQAIVAELGQRLGGAQGDDIARAFLMAANGNGLGDYHTKLRAFLRAWNSGELAGLSSQDQFMMLAAITPDQVCDELLPALCALRTAAGLMSTASDIVGVGCDLLLAAGLGAVLFPGDGPLVDAAVLASWAAACAPLEFAIDAAAVITDLVSDVDADLRLSASTTAPKASEPAVLTAALDVFGIDDVCQIAGSAATDKVVDKLAERMVNRLIMRKITMRAMNRIFTQLGEDFLQQFLGLLEKAASKTITSTGLDEAILAFAQPYCEDIYGAELVMNASRVLTGPEPNQGILTFRSDGRAEYLCPTAGTGSGAQSVLFTATKDICGTTQTKTVNIGCATRDVTITMGDNGSLNDDIFEVRVDGVTVLTSSTPVRSTSTTIQLEVGTTAHVQMLGRAAPDGVGTYFISFSGARVISGDPTSGTDLVPGAVKNFIIEVLP